MVFKVSPSFHLGNGACWDSGHPGGQEKKKRDQIGRMGGDLAKAIHCGNKGSAFGIYLSKKDRFKRAWQGTKGVLAYLLSKTTGRGCCPWRPIYLDWVAANRPKVFIVTG